MGTPGAVCRMLAPAAGKFQNRFAVGAFPVDGSPHVPYAVKLQFAEIFHGTPRFQKYLILPAAAGQIPGKHPVRHIDQYRPGKKGKYPLSRKGIQQVKDKPSHQQSVIQSVRTVSAVHEGSQLIFPVLHKVYTPIFL